MHAGHLGVHPPDVDLDLSIKEVYDRECVFISFSSCTPITRKYPWIFMQTRLIISSIINTLLQMLHTTPTLSMHIRSHSRRCTWSSRNIEVYKRIEFILSPTVLQPQIPELINRKSFVKSLIILNVIVNRRVDMKSDLSNWNFQIIAILKKSK